MDSAEAFGRVDEFHRTGNDQFAIACGAPGEEVAMPFRRAAVEGRELLGIDNPSASLTIVDETRCGRCARRSRGAIDDGREGVVGVRGLWRSCGDGQHIALGTCPYAHIVCVDEVLEVPEDGGATVSRENAFSA